MVREHNRDARTYQQQLRRTVPPRRYILCKCIDWRVRMKFTRESEIAQLDIQAVVHENVFWFDIPVPSVNEKTTILSPLMIIVAKEPDES